MKELLKNKARALAKKAQEDQALKDLARFVVILTLAAILLNAMTSMNPEMIHSRRHVAQQTNRVLQTLTLNSEYYPYFVQANTNSPNYQQLEQKLSELDFTTTGNTETRQFKAETIPQENQEEYYGYIRNLEKDPLIYSSPATIAITGEQNFYVDIVPECVGWIGLFAVIALIVAYPHATKKERTLGILITAPLMYLMNIFRVTTTIYSGWRWGIPVLEVVHGVLWKTLMVIWALFLWIMWTKYIVERTNKKATNK